MDKFEKQNLRYLIYKWCKINVKSYWPIYKWWNPTSLGYCTLKFPFLNNDALILINREANLSVIEFLSTIVLMDFPDIGGDWSLPSGRRGKVAGSRITNLQKLVGKYVSGYYWLSCLFCDKQFSRSMLQYRTLLPTKKLELFILLLMALSRICLIS